MAALTDAQLELLQRTRDGDPMWGGSTALPWLRRDVELLLALGLIAQDGGQTYRLTDLGRRALDVQA